MQLKKRKSMAEITKGTGEVPSTKTMGESAVPSANIPKGAELAVKANLSALKKVAKPAPKMEAMEEEVVGPGIPVKSSKYKEAIQKRINKKK